MNGNTPAPKDEKNIQALLRQARNTTKMTRGATPPRQPQTLSGSSSNAETPLKKSALQPTSTQSTINNTSLPSNLPTPSAPQTPEEMPQEENTPTTAQQNNDVTDNQETPSLRQALKTARDIAKQQKEKTSPAQKLTETTTKNITARLLSWSWTSLVPSFGFTLAYINFHFLLAHVVQNKSFCKFGEEWIPKTSGLGQTNSGLSMANGALGMLEILLLFILNIFLALIIGTLVFLVMLIIRHYQSLSDVLPLDWMTSIWSNPTSLIEKLFSF